MTNNLTTDPATVLDRLCEATAAHDLEGVVACFASDYRNETPAHPERGFVGQAQVRTNWARIFTMVPDITPAVLRFAVDGDVVWSEWEHRGTRTDGSRHLMRGVIIFGVDSEVISWARFYMEPVEESAEDANAFRERLLASNDQAASASRD
ncbi:MAG: nuclear transport factor 2 family protein [Ilumatobacteraceae bacterium]